MVTKVAGCLEVKSRTNIILLTIASIASAMMNVTSSAAEPVRLTFSSQSNFDSTINAKGTRYAYVSTRNGNMDIYLVDKDGSREEPISVHPADDYSPSMNKSGNRLAFVSRRDDSLGDIYFMKLGWSIKGFFLGRESTFVRVSRPKAEDRDPTSDPSSNKIYFATRDSGQQQFHLAQFNPDDEKVKEFENIVGEQPNVLPDGKHVVMVRSGKLYLANLEDGSNHELTLPIPTLCMQPKVDYQGNFIYLNCRLKDSSKDGALSLDDSGTVIRARLDFVLQNKGFAGQLLEELTSYESDAAFPAISDNEIQMTLPMHENLEIFALKADVETRFAFIASKREQNQIANDSIQRKREIVGAIQLAGDQARLTEVILDELDEVFLVGDRIDASYTRSRVIQITKSPRLLTEGDVVEVSGEVKEFIYPLVAIGKLPQNFDKKYAKALGRIKNTSNVNSIARSKIVFGQIEAARGNVIAAKRLFDEVLADSAKRPALSAFAEYLGTSVTSQSMGPELAVRNLTEVLLKHERIVPVAKMAIREINLQIQQSDSPPELLAEVKRKLKGRDAILVLLYEGLADFYLSQQKLTLAESAYRDALLLPYLKENEEEIAAIFWKLVDILERTGRFEEAEAEVNRRESETVAADRVFTRTEERKISLFWKRRAATLTQTNEPGMAVKRYREALEKDDGDLEAHRGYIDSMGRRGEQQTVADDYWRRLELKKTSLNQYLFALSLTYVADKEKDLKKRLQLLEQCAAEVEKALESEPANPYYFQTAGWIYQQRYLLVEKIDKEAANEGLLVSSYNKVSSVFRTSEANLLNKSLKAYENAERFADPDSLQKIIICQNLAEIYDLVGNPRKSLYFALRRIDAAAKLPFRNNEDSAKFYVLAARSAFKAEELALATSLYRRGAELFETTANQSQLASTLDALALSLREDRKFYEALRVYERLTEVQEAIGDKSNHINNLLNKAYCLAMMREPASSEELLNLVEPQLLADPNLLNPLKDTDDKVIVSLDKKATSYGKFDNFMRLLLVKTIRIEIADQQNNLDDVYRLWGEKVFLLKQRREIAMDKEDAPDAFLTMELAIAENNLGNIAVKSGKFGDAAEHFQQSLNWLTIFNDKSNSPDVDQLIAAKNILISLTAAIETGEGTAEDFKAQLTKTGTTVSSYVQQATSANVPLPFDTTKIESMYSENKMPEPLLENTSLTPTSEQNTELKNEQRNQRKKWIMDPSRRWLYLQSKGLVSDAYRSLIDALNDEILLESVSYRVQALNLTKAYFADTSVDRTAEAVQFANAWAREIHRRGSPTSYDLLNRTSDNTVQDIEKLRANLREDENLILLIPSIRGIDIFCIDAKSSIKLPEFVVSDRLLQRKVCGTDSKMSYVVAVADSVSQVAKFPSSFQFRLLPSPEFVSQDRNDKVEQGNSVQVVAFGDDRKLAESSVLETSQITPEDSAEVGGLAVHLDARLNCNPNQGGVSSFEFSSDKIQKKVALARAGERWFKSNTILNIPESNCFESEKKSVLMEGLTLVESTAIALGVSQFYIKQLDDSSKNEKAWQSFYEKLSLRDLDGAKLINSSTVIAGYRGQTAEEFKAIAADKLSPTTDEMFERYDDAELGEAAKIARMVMSYADAVEDFSAWQDGASVAIKSLFATGKFSAALYYQKQMILRKKSADPEEKMNELFSALALSIRASNLKDADFFSSELAGLNEIVERQRKLKEMIRYQALIAQLHKKYDETLALYEKSLKIAESEKDSAYVTERLLDIANIYREFLANYPKALEYYEQALQLARSQKNLELETRVIIDYANTLIAVARVKDAIDLLEPFAFSDIKKSHQLNWVRAAQVLGVAYYQSGLYQQSKDLNSDVLALLNQPSLVGRLELRLDAGSLKGMLEARLGDYLTSVQTFEEGISEATAAGLFSRASTRYNNLGYWSRENGSIDQSITYFEQALQIDRKNQLRSGEAFDLRNIGFSYLRKGQFERARQSLVESGKMSDEIGLVINKIQTLFGLGEIELRQGDFGTAESYFNQAFELAKKGDLRDLQWKANAGLGQIFFKQNRFEESEKKYSEAAGILETLRSGLNSLSSRSGFLAEVGVQEVYGRWVDSLMQLKQYRRGWEVSERARARAFLDSLGNQPWKFGDPKKTALAKREMDLRSKLSTASGDERTKLALEHQNLVEQIRNEYPDLLQLSAVEPISFEELNRLLPADTALLEYMVGEDNSYVWTLYQGKIEASVLSYKRADIERDLVAMQDLMKNVANAESLFERIGGQLIPKIETIRGAKHLAIVPHGALHQLPFAALKIDTKTVLLDLFPIHYLESATIARFVYGRPQISQKSGSLYAFGNPDLGPDLRLPFAEREVLSIKRIFPNVSAFIGKAATETNLKNVVNKANIVHIASHGEFNQLQPSESRLLLVSDAQNDGQVKVGEIFSFNLNRALVVLSACETGLGKVTNGDEVIGMNRAFLFAGAKTLISSLWRISDVASAVVMKRFYRGIQADSPLDEALRNAQLNVRERYPHPAFWAPMRLIGNYE